MYSPQASESSCIAETSSRRSPGFVLVHPIIFGNSVLTDVQMLLIDGSYRDRGDSGG
jgi:hypothetical protein